MCRLCTYTRGCIYPNLLALTFCFQTISFEREGRRNGISSTSMHCVHLWYASWVSSLPGQWFCAHEATFYDVIGLSPFSWLRGGGVFKFSFGRDVLPQNLKVGPYKYLFFKWLIPIPISPTFEQKLLSSVIFNWRLMYLPVYMYSPAQLSISNMIYLTWTESHNPSHMILKKKKKKKEKNIKRPVSLG